MVQRENPHGAGTSAWEQELDADISVAKESRGLAGWQALGGKQRRCGSGPGRSPPTDSGVDLYSQTPPLLSLRSLIWALYMPHAEPPPCLLSLKACLALWQGLEGQGGAAQAGTCSGIAWNPCLKAPLIGRPRRWAMHRGSCVAVTGAWLECGQEERLSCHPRAMAWASEECVFAFLVTSAPLDSKKKVSSRAERSQFSSPS